MTGYLFPNDEQENNRLDIFHHICLLLLGGKLHLAPIQHPQRILDVGTGTGIWAIEMGMIAKALPPSATENTIYIHLRDIFCRLFPVFSLADVASCLLSSRPVSVC